MINFIKIQDKINELLVKLYPDFTVYINQVPQNFERPSFCIDFVSNTVDDNNKELVKEIDYFTITYFAEVNEYYNTDKFNLQNVLLGVLNIFRNGFIEVDDRAVKVKASKGGFNDNEVYIDLQFEYYDNRVEKTEEEEEYEIMRKVYANVTDNINSYVLKIT